MVKTDLLVVDHISYVMRMLESLDGVVLLVLDSLGVPKSEQGLQVPLDVEENQSGEVVHLRGVRRVLDQASAMLGELLD